VAHIQRRGQGRWRVRYRDPEGRERSLSFNRRADAQRWLAANETARAKGDWVDPALGRRTFGDWSEHRQTTLVGLRPATRNRDLRILRVHLIPHFGSSEVNP
jgi:hypothetical protein